MEKSSFFVLLSRDETSVEASMKIKEIIVVEGKDDTVAIKRAVDADTIETNGSAIGDHVIEQVKLALQKRGVIIFTDPDYPGERIRKIISDKVPGCKHAFYRRKKHLLRGKKVLGLNMLLMNQFAVL